MVKSLLQQVMLKADAKVESKPAFLNTQELIDKINYGYIAKRGTKFAQKKTFAPSTIAYSHGECLLLSCEETAVVSKWWASAHMALKQYQDDIDRLYPQDHISPLGKD